jgi:hypothetical protein
VDQINFPVKPIAYAKKFSEKKFGQTQIWQKGEIQRSISLAYESHGLVFRAEATIPTRHQE